MQNILNPNKERVDIPNDDGGPPSTSKKKANSAKEERVKEEVDGKEAECKTRDKERINLKPKLKAPVISIESKLSAMTPAFEPRARTQWIQQNLSRNQSTFPSHLGAQSIVLHPISRRPFDFGRRSLYQQQ